MRVGTKVLMPIKKDVSRRAARQTQKEKVGNDSVSGWSSKRLILETGHRRHDENSCGFSFHSSWDS